MGIFLFTFKTVTVQSHTGLKYLHIGLCSRCNAGYEQIVYCTREINIWSCNNCGFMVGKWRIEENHSKKNSFDGTFWGKLLQFVRHTINCGNEKRQETYSDKFNSNVNSSSLLKLKMRKWYLVWPCTMGGSKLSCMWQKSNTFIQITIWNVNISTQKSFKE